MEKKLFVGQTVWVLHRGSLVEKRIESVGKKYFTLPNIRNKFTIDGLKEVTEYTSTITIYLDKQVYLDEVERRELWKEINNALNVRNIPLELLRSIKELLTPSLNK